MQAVFTGKPKNSSERVGTATILSGWTPKPRECCRSTAIYVWRVDSALLRAIKMMSPMYTTQWMPSRRKCRIAGCIKLGRNVGCQGEAKGHCHALILRTVEREAEESLAGLADRQGHVEVRKVDLCEVVAAIEDRLSGVCALHLEVPLYEMAIDERT